MTEIEKMQQLHLRASLGEELTANERAALQSWYDELDREEAVINRNNRNVDLEAMREMLEKTTRQVAASNRRVVELLEQNERIRRENARLRRELEARLAKRSAT